MRELKGYKGREVHPYFSPWKSIKKDRRVVDGNFFLFIVEVIFHVWDIKWKCKALKTVHAYWKH